MTKIYLLIASLFLVEASSAQYAYFGTRGKISFDKVTYIRARMRDMQQQMTRMNNSMGPGGAMRMGGNLDNMPESNTQRMTLHFDEDETLLMNEESATPTNQQNNRGGAVGGGNRGGNRQGPGGGMGSGNTEFRMGMRGAGGNNQSKVLYQNIKNNKSEVQVEIDEKYIIVDSLESITWRFTDEYRNIAGYECRRVNGATKDSLYLVAFYTDQIPLSAGPALVNGLPGMVLGLIIPEMHIQYWATQVEFTNETVPTNWKDKKSKDISFGEFVNSFGRFFQRGRDNNNNKRQILEQLIY